MKCNQIFSKITLSFIWVMLPAIGFADLPDPGCDPMDPACPIDVGVSLLIAAGIGLGAKKAYQEHNVKNASTDSNRS